MPPQNEALKNIPSFKAIPPKPVEQPPSEDKLRLMLANGPEFIDLVEGFISKFSLPYYVEKHADGTAILKDTLSQGELHLKKFITVNEEMLQMKEDARKISKSPYEVLIVGPTGTGKEIVAKSMIADRKGHIKAVNCAGLPENLIESELFGHVKGAFTGAESQKQGLMAAAADGVMFLDEIGEMPMPVQAKLLRAIQEKRIRKVGSNVDEEIQCKVVCATHRNLREMVKSGTFREDLYARVSTLTLKITALLDRKEDIIPITESLEHGKKFLAQHQIDLMQGAFDLSLNVRSLQQHVIRYHVLGRVVKD